MKADPTAEKVLQDIANITFNPATGAPYPFSNRATRAFPTWGVVGQQHIAARIQGRVLR